MHATADDDGALPKHRKSAEGHGYVVAVIGDVHATAGQLAEHTAPHRHLGWALWVHGCWGMVVRVYACMGCAGVCVYECMSVQVYACYGWGHGCTDI